jgi:hypothetical protein
VASRSIFMYRLALKNFHIMVQIQDKIFVKYDKVVLLGANVFFVLKIWKLSRDLFESHLIFFIW